MRALSASDQLRVWERGRRQTSAARALLLLAAYSERSMDELARVSLGRRDAQLLDLRERIFGARIEAFTACLKCGENLELTFDTTQIRLPDVIGETAGQTYLLESEGYEVRFRPPDTTDLRAIAGCENVEAARSGLLERCICEIRYTGPGEGAGNRGDRLPARVLTELVEMMSQIDPQANIQLSLTCPACGHNWPAIFDIASFIWSEINDWAKSLLREVHFLALAYKWGEADVVEMSADRRAFYLEMLGQT